MHGVVSHGSGGAVLDARVTLWDAGRNLQRSGVTDAEGRYAITGLLPGKYLLVVEAIGFKKVERPGIELQVQQRGSIDILLTAGEVSTRVEVREPALLNSAGWQLGQVVDTRYLTTLPLIGRNAMSLITLAPGVTPVNISPGGQTSTNFVANGSRNSTADVLLDGTSVTNVEQNSGVTDLKYFPAVDALQEFKVQTNALPAEFGNTGGAIVNSILKSGTSQFHGVGYGFHRNSALNSNNWFSNRAGRGIPDFKRNLFGGNSGGPLWIPKIHDGRGRTFFFATFETLRQESAATRSATIPTLQERRGDFSETLAGEGQLIAIFNPLDVRPTAEGPRRMPFAGNRIPASTFSPVAVRALSYYPRVTSEGEEFTRVNNFFAQGVNLSRSMQMDFKIDHAFSERSRLSSRYSRLRGESLPANLLGNPADRFTDGDTATHNQNGLLEYTRVHSPTLLIMGRVGVLRSDATRTPQGLGFDQTQLGLPDLFLTSGIRLFPAFSPEGYQGLGTSAFALVGRGEDVSSAAASVTMIRGVHSIKAGAEARFLRLNYLQPAFPQGNFVFGRLTTSENPFAGNAAQGNAVASMLLGWGTGGNYSIDPWSASASRYMAFYIQDDWRVTRKLTLSLGLRYDFDVPRTERYDRLSWFDAKAESPLAGKVEGYSNLRGQLRFSDRQTRSPVDGDYNNWQPRFGFAWVVTSKTAVRGAYGVQHSLSRGTVKGHLGAGFQTDSNPEFSRDGGVTPYATLRNPFPNGLLIPPERALGAATLLGLSVATDTRPNRSPHYQMWNFSIQRELLFDSLLEVNYTGSKGTHLYFGGGVESMNRLDESYWSVGRTQLNSNAANPFHGVIDDARSPLSTATTQLHRLLRPFPQYTAVLGATPGIANSIYHAMQVRYEKRFSRGLTLLGHYTWAKMIDDSSFSSGNVAWLGGAAPVQNYSNLRLERAVSAMDISHRAVVSLEYQIPGSLPVLRGWAVSSLTTLSSGYPVIPALQGGVLWEGAQRPNLTGSAAMPGSVTGRLNGYLNAAAFARPAPDTFGTAPRTLGVRTPGVRASDLAMRKRFFLSEQRFIELRLEAQNWLNHPVFGAPDGTFGAASFGVISTTAVGPREVQLGLKFYF